ncbi:hypothetical protein TNCV_3513421 [Trichonephila clavipes]|nr:hypothetical protein TNCV_3513421 [Trichonephila clavipes]
MTQRTAPWENWHLERGFELLRTFGLVRWGLGGSGHVEGTGKKAEFCVSGRQIPSGGSPSLGEVSAADKGRWVYPLDPRPDSVVLYSECTSGKRHAWYLPDDRHTAPLLDSVVGGGTPG